MASGSFAVASSNKYVSCTCWWASTPNTDGNYSDVDFELRASRTNSGYTTYGAGSGGVTINEIAVPFSISPNQKITQNSNTLLGSGSVRVYHNNDGSKSVKITAQASIPGASLTLGPTSETVTLDTIQRCATISSAPNFTNLDNPIIKYSNPAGFKVNTWIEINPTNTHLCIREDIGDGGSYTYELTDDERASLIECCTKDTATVRFGMYTYNGSTLIGTHYVDKKFSLTEDIIPTVNVALSDTEGHFDKYGKYVQGQSKLHISIIAEGVYGSTIKSYKTMFDGKTFTDAEFTTDAITGKDELNLEIVVTDSRDRTCTVKESIAVYEYKPPKIMSINAKRCQKHNVNEIGNDYLGVVFNSEVTSLASQNPVKYELDYKKITEDLYTTVSLSDYANIHEVEGHAIFQAENDAYHIILRITDDFGTVEKKTHGPSISVLVSKLKYNLGLAFGKLAELAGVLDIGFKTRFHGGILHVALEDGAIADNVLTPNRYLVKAPRTYVGFPETGVEAVLDVVGDDEIIKQTFSVTNETNHRAYERIYTYENEMWSNWKMTRGNRWTACTVEANSAAGNFYKSADGIAYYRYDDEMLEVCLKGTFVTSATVAESTEFFTLTGLDVEIPYGVAAPMWDDSGQKWVRIELGTDGKVLLTSDGSIPSNHWLAFTGIKFNFFRNHQQSEVNE